MFVLLCHVSFTRWSSRSKILVVTVDTSLCQSYFTTSVAIKSVAIKILWKPCSSTSPLPQWKTSSTSNLNLPSFSLKPFPLILSLWTPLKSRFPSLKYWSWILSDFIWSESDDWSSWKKCFFSSPFILSYFLWSLLWPLLSVVLRYPTSLWNSATVRPRAQCVSQCFSMQFVCICLCTSRWGAHRTPIL